jgi:hypothetical protein
MYLKNLKYILKHKWFVFLACCRLGIWWRGITHDLSKFRPSEFIPYARHFFNDVKRGATGYYKSEDTLIDPNFDYAWFLHQKRNDHHWQYWIIPLDEDENGPTCSTVEMPLNVCKEMVADWIGAGRVQGTPNTKRWYEVHGPKLQLHPQTRQTIEKLLGVK